ncbi:MAG: FAD-dependent oxidoreductase [Coriobacteriales bacterium]|jgi:fumarate reductase flavoprotein subunit|nr:FAD-dependent oxidoreductase [Coriobacteriales bacterium]
MSEHFVSATPASAAATVTTTATVANGLTRRGFLATAAIGATGLAAAFAGCAPSNTGSATSGSGDATATGARSEGPVNVEEDLAAGITVEETIDADVVVIGGGASGCMAASLAAENGAKVILVEKSNTLGGCFNLSFSATTWGYPYAPEGQGKFELNPFIKDWVANSHWRCDPSVIRQLLVNSGEAYGWVADHGFELMFLSFFGSDMLMLPDYALRPTTWRKIVDDVVVAKGGGQLLTETTAKKLLTDASGAICGVIAESDGKGVQINCKAVSISTGGYAGNPEMVLEASGFGGVNGSLPQNIGEGLKMAWAVGATKPINFGGLMLHQTLAKATNDLVPILEPFPAKYPMISTYLPMTLDVGASGVRFRDESQILDPVAAANSSAFQGAFHYKVFSKKILDTLQSEGLVGIGQMTKPGLPPEFQPEYAPETPWTDVYEVFDKMVELGFGYKGDTVEELAKNAGMDVDIFTQTFASYESFCATGDDLQFAKDAQFLLPYGNQGPYYIVVAEINNLGTWGGLLTNLNYQVLDDNRLVVKGLYATGSEAGTNLYNDTYVGSGIGLCNTVTSGYLCGKAMAAFVK